LFQINAAPSRIELCAAMGRARRPLIAVVEDDPAVLNSLEFALQAEGYGVCAFQSAPDALASAKILNADCAILDYAMPELTGVALLIALRQRGFAGPALIIASNPPVRCRNEAAAVGAPVIEKPLTGDVLLGRIRLALGEARG
jgi:DNA-binding response OmpR family regulator